jgi:hypothetical protein
MSWQVNMSRAGARILSITAVAAFAMALLTCGVAPPVASEPDAGGTLPVGAGLPSDSYCAG